MGGRLQKQTWTQCVSDSDFGEGLIQIASLLLLLHRPPRRPAHDDDAGGLFNTVAMGAVNLGMAHHQESLQRAEDADADAATRQQRRGGGGSTLWSITKKVCNELGRHPWRTVYLSAVAQRGRHPELYPFQGHIAAIRSIHLREGLGGLLRGSGAHVTAETLRMLAMRASRGGSGGSSNAEGLAREFAGVAGRGTIARNRVLQPVAPILESVGSGRWLGEPLRQVGICVALSFSSHPLELLATRMMTDSRVGYDTVRAALATVVEADGWRGLYVGVEATLMLHVRRRHRSRGRGHHSTTATATTAARNALASHSLSLPVAPIGSAGRLISAHAVITCAVHRRWRCCASRWWVSYVIEAPWLVNSGHGASLRHHNGRQVIGARSWWTRPCSCSTSRWMVTAPHRAGAEQVLLSSQKCVGSWGGE
jgi:hypothetical protein